MFVEGKIMQLIVLIVTTVAIYYYTEAVKKGKEIEIRPMPALEAIDEAVGRCGETGRPLLFTPGFSFGGLFHSTMAPLVMAGLAILRKVADSTAKKGVPIIVSLNQPEAVPMVEDVLKVAYARERQEVPTNAVRFISTEQYAWAAGTLSIMLEDKPGASVLMGHFWSEALQLCEGSKYIGAMLIGGTGTSQIATMVASCDYCLFGEELFAARAYIERLPELLGTVAGQDVLKLISICIAVFAFLAGNLNMPWLIDLLTM